MITQLFLGTFNLGKQKEIKAVLKSHPCQLHTPQSFNITVDIPETGNSYQDNAILKAKHFHSLTQMPTLAEDSGIVVEALKNQLGVKTRRWGAGQAASDEEWLAHFMQVMQNFPNPEDRKAKFISHFTLIYNHQTFHFTGETHGTITLNLEAPIYSGLPLSSVFKPQGFTQVYQALSEDQKNQISHRGKALHSLKNFLTTLSSPNAPS